MYIESVRMLRERDELKQLFHFVIKRAIYFLQELTSMQMATTQHISPTPHTHRKILDDLRI